jgi:hypothetical protein
MKVWKLKLYLVAEELFQFLLVTYLVLLLIETLQEGFVSYFFNLHLLLIPIILNSLIIVITYDEKLPSQPKTNKLNKVYITLLTIGGAFLVFYKATAPETAAIIFALITLLLLLFLSFLPANDR